MSNIKSKFAELGRKAQYDRAVQRRAKVKCLKDKGLSGPQIAEKLGVKLRTIYADFSILKKEKETRHASTE